MKKYLFVIFSVCFVLVAETLFEVKDASNNKVLDVSTDGLRILNQGDTVMVVSPSGVRVNLDNSNKALSRTFAVTTSSSKNKGLNRVLEVGTESTTMREGDLGERYTDFSPDNIFLGLRSGITTNPGVPYPESGRNNIFIGNESGYKNSSGYDNVFIGDSAGVSNTSGYRNINIGRVAGKNNTFGSDNIYIGYKAGSEGTTTSQNIAIGNYAGRMNESSQNMFIGEYAGESNYSGDRNSFVGFFSGQKNVSGTNNSYFGQMAGMDNVMSNNTMIGYWAGGKNVDGQKNTFLGYRSGVESRGSDNVFLGYQAGELNYGSDNVMIGYQAGMQSLDLSNSLYIANSSTNTPLIKGSFPNTNLTLNAQTVEVNGKLGVGVTAPSYRIHSVDQTTENDYPAVYGKHNVTNNYGVGVTGDGGYRGVIGNGNATSGFVTGVRGVANGTGTGSRFGVYGTSVGGDNNYGLYGYSSGTGYINYGVYATASGATTNYAGYFNGNVYIAGTVTADDYIEFKSDHPIDPENKYLSHSSVASSEMKNIYDGVVTLDSNGGATVELPDWFEEYNSNFRYQMTAIGKPCPNIYISKKIKNGVFEIAGGEPGAEICWLITSTRNDNYAKTNPVRIETYKNDSERGLYINPKAFGLGEEKGLRSLDIEETVRDK
jgi:hypothetical protein